jgi:predicted metal-dependent enzyme (double-stranded beta helix superfamily)
MYRIQLILLTLLGVTANADHHGDGPPNSCHQYYPNIAEEVLLENDQLVVQRYIVQPGEWEGIHPHPANQLYVHIKGGEWTVRYGDQETTSVSPDGEIGWSDTALELDAMHESGNTGNEPIDFMWITLKPGCMAEN